MAWLLTKFTRNGDEVLTVGRSLRLHDGDLRGDLLTVVVLTIRRLGHQDLRVTRIRRLQRHDIDHTDIARWRRLQNNFLLFRGNCATMKKTLRLSSTFRRQLTWLKFTWCNETGVNCVARCTSDKVLVVFDELIDVFTSDSSFVTDVTVMKFLAVANRVAIIRLHNFGCLSGKNRRPNKTFLVITRTIRGATCRSFW